MFRIEIKVNFLRAFVLLIFIAVNLTADQYVSLYATILFLIFYCIEL